MLVIGSKGEPLGVMATHEALKKAEEVGLDLVEVSPTAQPPVCRIMDYGKYKYELSKKEHGAKGRQKGTVIKEIKFRPFTDKHDMEFKIRHAKHFLEEGDKVKLTLTFRGRERAYQETGRAIMDKVVQELAGLGVPDQSPRMEGRNLIMIVTPKG